jgi:hypothetical protein
MTLQNLIQNLFINFIVYTSSKIIDKTSGMETYQIMNR